MIFKKGELVFYIGHDEWYIEGHCSLKPNTYYRVQAVRELPEANGITIYKIGQWWVMPESVEKAYNDPIQVGDKVRIALRVVKEEGWDNAWVAGMDQHLGLIYTIHSISDKGVVFKEDKKYNWPPSCLEPV